MSLSSAKEPSPLLTWLFERQRFGIQPGLERIRLFLERLGHPERTFDTVLVGGTNGKGSTAATLEAIFRANGRRSGLFTSPHLTRLSERFLVAGEELPSEQVLAGLARIKPIADEIGASFFEVVTALGLDLFREAEVEVAVMEVGLGGRYDATNALEPLLSIITNVSLDHTDILGHTEEAIAQEKAGILRVSRPAVSGVSSSLRPVLEKEGAELWVLGQEVQWSAHSLGWQGSLVRVECLGEALEVHTPLLGRHGAENVALAVAAARRLGLDSAVIRQGVAQTRWPGRLEVLPWQWHTLLLDGAHNPAGAQALAQALHDLHTGPLPIIFGAAQDKDLRSVAQALAPLASRLILTKAQLSPRAASPAALATLFSEFSTEVPITLTESPSEALTALKPEEHQALVCGSLYLIGEVRPLVLGEQGERQERWQ